MNNYEVASETEHYVIFRSGVSQLTPQQSLEQFEMLYKQGYDVMFFSGLLVWCKRKGAMYEQAS